MHARLSRYDSWLKGQWPRLMGLSRSERETVLWAKRRELFGTQADALWAAELKSARSQVNLGGIDREKGSTLSGKLAAYENSLRKAYGKDTEAYISAHRQDLVKRFLSLPGVQADLRAMDPAARRDTLMVVRSAFGMDGQTLQRWEQLDRLRDERWDKGMAYMAERGKVSLEACPDVREQALDELRVRYFLGEAAVIAGEEDAGYYRFRARRMYGLN